MTLIYIVLSLIESGTIDLFPDTAAQKLQFMYLCCTMGLLLSSAISRPYVASDKTTQDGVHSNQTAHGVQLNLTDVVYDGDNPDFESHIDIPYGIIGGLCFASAIYMLIVWAHLRKSGDSNASQKSTDSRGDQDSKSENEIDLLEKKGEEWTASQQEEPDEDRHAPVSKWWTVFWSAIMLSFERGVDVMAFSYLTNYLVYIGLSKQTSIDINSYFNLAYNLIRILGIFVLAKIQVRTLLATCLTLSTVAMIGLYFAGSHQTPVYVNVIVMGVFLSTNYPSTYAYINERIRMSPLIGGIVLCASGVIMGTEPILIGYLIRETPQIFLYLLLCNSLIVICSMIIIELSLAHFQRDSIKTST